MLKTDQGLRQLSGLLLRGGKVHACLEEARVQFQRDAKVFDRGGQQAGLHQGTAQNAVGPRMLWVQPHRCGHFFDGGVKPDTVAHRKEMLHMMRAKGAGGQAGCGLLHLGQCRQKPRIGRKFFQRHQDLAAHLRRTTRSDLGLGVAQHFVDVDAHIGLWMTFVLD